MKTRARDRDKSLERGILRTMNAIGGMENRVMKYLSKIQPVDRNRDLPVVGRELANRMIGSPEYMPHDNRIAE